MFVAGQSVRKWIFEGIREVLAKEGLHPGKLDFYQAIDKLAEPFPEEVLLSLSEEEIERRAIQIM